MSIGDDINDFINEQLNELQNKSMKKKSATDLINNLIEKDIIDEMEKRIEAINSRIEIYESDFPTANTYNRFGGHYEVNPYPTPSPFPTTEFEKYTTKMAQKPRQTYQQMKVVDERVDAKLSEFNDKTHDVIVYSESLVDDELEETIEKKIIGKETVDWWEYILLYGFKKYFEIELMLSKNSGMINTPKKIKKFIDTKKWVVCFKPKTTSLFEKRIEIRDGKSVECIIGRNYSQKEFKFESIYKPVNKTNEFIEKGIIYEEKINTFELDMNELIANIEKILNDNGVNNTLITKTKKEFYGRLRGI